MTDLYTLVQHTGYTVGDDLSFQRAVEVRGVGKVVARRIEKAGGLVFEGYDPATDREEAENYPDPNNMGLVAQVQGGFMRVEGIDEPVYTRFGLD